MNLADLMKIIPEDQWLCVVITESGEAPFNYYYPPKEILPKEWMDYLVISIDAIGMKHITITVQEVENV